MNLAEMCSEMARPPTRTAASAHCDKVSTEARASRCGFVPRCSTRHQISGSRRRLRVWSPAATSSPGHCATAGCAPARRRRRRVCDAAVLRPRRMETRDGVFNAVAMSGYSRRLGRLLDAGRFPLVLGGDCSIVLGAALALNRPGRYGLAFLDGHSDFRHLGNSPRVGAAAGEDLALVTGRGQADLTDLDGPAAVCAGRGRGRAWHPRQRWALAELHGLGVPVWEVARLRADGPATATSAALRHLERDGVDGLWLHLDADILDPAVLPAVDSPDPGGLGHDELAAC